MAHSWASRVGALCTALIVAGAIVSTGFLLGRARARSAAVSAPACKVPLLKPLKGKAVTAISRLVSEGVSDALAVSWKTLKVFGDMSYSDLFPRLGTEVKWHRRRLAMCLRSLNKSSLRMAEARAGHYRPRSLPTPPPPKVYKRIVDDSNREVLVSTHGELQFELHTEDGKELPQLWEEAQLRDYARNVKMLESIGGKSLNETGLAKHPVKKSKNRDQLKQEKLLDPRPRKGRWRYPSLNNTITEDQVLRELDRQRGERIGRQANAAEAWRRVHGDSEPAWKRLIRENEAREKNPVRRIHRRG